MLTDRDQEPGALTRMGRQTHFAADGGTGILGRLDFWLLQFLIFLVPSKAGGIKKEKDYPEAGNANSRGGTDGG